MNKVTCIKNKDYSTISNVFLRDKNLSLKAKGMLAMILALPDDWDFSINGICAVIKEGKTAIYSAIDELKEFGYCRVETIRDERGVIQGTDYTFIENPRFDYPYLENPNMDNQPQISIEGNNLLESTLNNKQKEKSEKDPELFEECWLAYRRKGVKKKAKEYWNKLTDVERKNVMPHIKAYVANRDLQYQKDFERYLRDGIFKTVVFNGNKVVYDPTKLGRGESAESVYMPTCDGALSWNDYYNCFMYVGFWDGRHIADGYTDETRPNGATITLNNGRGTITWNSDTKQWEKV